ncbi:MAG: hypothetical protein ACF8OB_16245 [Phycisphaeraceae bacterium JB051]
MEQLGQAIQPKPGFMYFCSTNKQCRFSDWAMRNAKFAARHVTDGLSDKNRLSSHQARHLTNRQIVRQTPDFAVKIRKYISKSQKCLKMIEGAFSVCGQGLSEKVRI